MLNFLLLIVGAVLCNFEKKMILETHESVSKIEFLTRTLPPVREENLESVGFPVAQLFLGISDINFTPNQFTKLAFDMDNKKMFLSSKDVSNFTCIDANLADPQEPMISCRVNRTEKVTCRFFGLWFTEILSTEARVEDCYKAQIKYTIFNHSYIFTRQWKEEADMNKEGFVDVYLIEEGDSPPVPDLYHTNSVFGLSPISEMPQYMIQTYSMEQDTFEFSLSGTSITFEPLFDLDTVALFTKKLETNDTRWILRGANLTLTYPADDPTEMRGANKKDGTLGLFSGLKTEEIDDVSICFTNRLNTTLTLGPRSYVNVVQDIWKAVCGDKPFPCQYSDEVLKIAPSIQLKFKADIKEEIGPNEKEVIALTLLPYRYINKTRDGLIVLDVN